MNQKALRTLEYDKIIEKLTGHASSALGKERCRTLLPSSDLAEIRRMQRETADGLTRLFKKGGISFGSVHDIRALLKRLDLGASLGIADLLSVCSLLENAARVKAFGRHQRDDEPEDSLDALFSGIEPVSTLSAEIRRCIISEDELADDASPTLRQIRRSMHQCEDRIHTQLGSYISGSSRTYLQDGVITMRDNRYCIPVKVEYKNQVPGIVHDQSSTGSTLFVEPMAIVRLNNEIRELELKEQAEIEVILSSLSARASAHQEELKINLDLLSELDFIFARSSLAMEQDAAEPALNTEGRINLKKARHPLLDRQTAVPIDVRLGEDFHLLIITGPNTGGKTVSLKTTGLLTLMAQAGLHIPALERSQVAVFTEVYADIGDEQSIEQSLSTFSSHMTNVVSFLEKATRESLVLFDELGAGTDPTEGAALAISILSYLHKKEIRTMATTHYSELKVYALSTPGVENASCEFSVETLRPTYHLLIGVPGKSNAFAISSKLGLPDHIIENAKKQISTENEAFEDVISTLEENRVTLERERVEIESYKQEVARLKKQLEDKYEKLDERRDRILREANEEARRTLQGAKDYADQTMKAFNKAGKSMLSAKELEKERERLRQKMSGVESHLSIKQAPAPKKELKATDLSIGDMIRVLSMNLKGTVSTLPDAKGMLYVQLGIMRTKVPLRDLELVDEPVITGPSLKKTGSGAIKMSKSANTATEINLIGKTVDEAVAELDKYLDDAYLSHIPVVRIVHGKGTGALRRGIHQYLKRLSYVASFRLGEFGEGDAGVTIVEFKK